MGTKQQSRLKYSQSLMSISVAYDSTQAARARAYARKCHARPSPPPRRIRANHTVHAHTQATLHATTVGAPFILIIFIITMYIPFFIRGRTHTRMHPLFADALSMCQLIMLHAVATIVPAPRCPRACCPLRTSRYVACHARRRCDGPCEWVAFRGRMSTHACRVM